MHMQRACRGVTTHTIPVAEQPSRSCKTRRARCTRPNSTARSARFLMRVREIVNGNRLLFPRLLSNSQEIAYTLRNLPARITKFCYHCKLIMDKYCRTLYRNFYIYSISKTWICIFSPMSMETIGTIETIESQEV